jgi:hypothetical protein
MIPAWSLAGVRHDLEHRFERDGFHTNAVKMVGLLLARPQSALARSEIVPNLPYFHHRAGKHIHFFCVGYGGYWPPEHVPDAENVVPIDHVPDAENVVTIDQTEWLYSDQSFNWFRAELEAATRWRYSGGTDLVLTNAVWDAELRSADLDFTSALAMNLEQAVADGAVPDVARWFESIFQFAEHNTDDDPTWGFGVSAGLVAARSGLVSAILSLLPGSFGSEAKKLPYFMVTDLAA